MPPAVVLSQDQTLKFIPGRLPSTPYKGLHNARINARARATHAAARASLPPSPQPQSTIPPRQARLKGAALISPPHRSRQHRISTLYGSARLAQQPVNVIVTFRDVQWIVAKNRPRSQIRPRARSSASIRLGDPTGADRSGGASS